MRRVTCSHSIAANAPKAKKPGTPKPVRWLSPKDAEKTNIITEWIESHCPPDVSVQCDDYNGRWRVISEELNWKSISWTKRGYQAAAMMCIHQAWHYYLDGHKEKCPFDLKALEKEFRELEMPAVAA